MEARLTAEVTVVCREYCAKMYNQALDWAGIPVDFDLRMVDQVYFQRTSEKTRQLLLLQPPFPFLLLNNLSQPKKPSRDTEVPVGAEKEKSGAVVASRTEEKAKEKENGKEKIKNKADANPSEDALTIGDMVSKAKVVESKSKIDSKKDSH